MAKHKGGHRNKSGKPLIRQCVWCKKVLKAGDYLTEGGEALCSAVCLNEWKTRQSILNRELDGQSRTLLDKRLKAHGLVDSGVASVFPQQPVSASASKFNVQPLVAPDIAMPLAGTVLPKDGVPTDATALPTSEPLPEVSRQDLIRGITVAEFLDGRSDEEIERLAERIMVGRRRPWLTRYNIALAVLALLLMIILFATFRKKDRFYAVALENKHKIEMLRKKLEVLTSTTVPVDTTGLAILFPAPGHSQKSRYVNITGKTADSMSLTLFVNNSIRAQRRLSGAFAFYDISLVPGENSIVVKGVDADNKVYSRSVSVQVEEKGARGPRNINYEATQPFVPNQYPDNLNYTRGNPNKKLIALTFDGSSHEGEALNILDTLKSRGVKGTFFLTGQFLERHLPLVRRMAADGHILGNHTYDHPHLTTYESNGRQDLIPGVTRDVLQDDLRKTMRLFEQLGLPSVPLWRAPYGDQNHEINSWAEALGLKHIGWTQGSSWRTNLDTNDWVEHPGDAGYFQPEEVIRKVVSFGKGSCCGLNGGIILMHIGTLRKENQFYTRMGEMIDTLRNAGYQFVTVPEMLTYD